MVAMWKSLSETLDELTLSLHRILVEPAFRGSPHGAPPDFDALIAEETARPPEVRWPAQLERRVGRLRVRIPALELETFADFHPAEDPRTDTLFVWHHGLGEFPHDGAAGAIFAQGRLRDRVDWMAIKGAHHETPRAISEHLLKSHETFARVLLSSVFVARALAAPLRERYRHVVMGGISMGGVVSLLEAAAGGSRFDLHVPVLAGPDIAQVLFKSSFTRVVCRRYLKREGESVRLAIDLGSRLEGEGTPIRALLASYDRLFCCAPQRAAYARIPRARVEVMSGGHVTAALRFPTLAAFVTGALEGELWAKAAAPTAALSA